MKRLSKYTHLLEARERYFIFNIANGIVVALNPRLYSLIEEHCDDPEMLRNIHPALFENMINAGMLIEDDTDEAAELISRFEEVDNDPSQFGIIVNPTLDCNLRCWYCYEKHRGGSMMKPEVIESIKKLIDAKVADTRLTKLSLSFFGGEPLLGWSKVVIPLLGYAVKVCRNRSIHFDTGFTTNGVLLSEQKFNELSDLGLNNTSFQISFDGNRVFHDSSRIGISKQPTYDKIMRNVALGASRGFIMNLRFNYTPETIDSFVDILSEFEQLPEESKRHIICNFQQVWQTGGDGGTTRNKAVKLVEAFKASGFAATSDTLYHRHVCYADNSNNIVVNYNGDLYKCTAREFDSATREGVLHGDGNVEWNERYNNRMKVRYAVRACRECSIMPICNGGCSQNKLERNDIHNCPYRRSESEKRHMIIGALYDKVFSQLISYPIQS